MSSLQTEMLFLLLKIKKLHFPVTTVELNRALIGYCNYTKGSSLMDLTNIQQPIAMLRNINLLDNDRKLTDTGYKLLSEMKIFDEVNS